MNNIYLFPPNPMFPIPPITYTSSPGGMQVGKFPNPRNIFHIGNNKEAQNFLSRGGQVIIRMRGLPYDCTSKQVTDFFENGELGCDVLDKEDGVLFVRKPDGRATGDAFVLFDEEKDAELALQKHKEIIGSRYIELFRSTTAEVQQVLNRTMEQNSNPRHGHHNNNHAAVAAAAAAAALASNVNPQLPMIPPMSNAGGVLPQQMVTTGTRKDCIRLRGLPYEAQVEHILEFLGEHAKNIVNQGVHMVYNAQGQPSGEAFIEMTSEPAAFQSAHHRHHRNMTFGKKQRYIEVFQCSGEDMNFVLTGNSLAGVGGPPSSQSPPSKNPYLASGGGLLPPGSLPPMFSPTHAPPLLNGPPSPNTNGTSTNHSPVVSLGMSLPPSVSSLGSNYPFNGNMMAFSQNHLVTSHPPPHHHHHAHRPNPYAFQPQFIYWPYPSPPISPTSYYNSMPNGIMHNGSLPGTPNGSIASLTSPPMPGTPTLLTVDVMPPVRGMESRMAHIHPESFPSPFQNGKMSDQQSHLTQSPPPTCDLSAPPPLPSVQVTNSNAPTSTCANGNVTANNLESATPSELNQA